MKKSQKAILELMEQYLEKHPEQRFGLALFNLGINEFADKVTPKAKEYLLRDIYTDGDKEILNRIQKAKRELGL